MVGGGDDSVMASPTCWYSAGQTLWAGFGILATLWYAQCWRRSRLNARAPTGRGLGQLAGWFWTIGHLAGPVAAVYLWLTAGDDAGWPPRCPMAATVLGVARGAALGGGKIDSTVSFHGREHAAQAAGPLAGFVHTAQAIPENLILANLGLKAQTTAAPGELVISLDFGRSWAASQRAAGRGIASVQSAGMHRVWPWFSEPTWSSGRCGAIFRFRSLRTINLGMIVPWYDVVPQIGAVLFVAGWCRPGPRGEPASPDSSRSSVSRQRAAWDHRTHWCS